MDDHSKRSSSSLSNDQHGMQLDFYHNNNNNNKINIYNQRSYSLNNSNTFNHNNNNINNNNNNNEIAYEYKLKRSKTTTTGISPSNMLMCFNDPEFKRKSRVASYRALTFEGKVKGSFRKSFKRVKNFFIHGWMVVSN
ncbi:hypothetical protein vseg_002952 [Gypsophila vaccaria]